ncbi:hypothetical protein O6H91_10G078500 [Diphasiastrum complanatum]|uniref:Uncharacterized protein n=1 Tax=Diphasiastrum complanatum TaxID=34168 RepID=A0ACC2CIV5_DIPCM|nr:hypothetical protein O6H91_10G078500 [Diphasiastrum complanatum]
MILSKDLFLESLFDLKWHFELAMTPPDSLQQSPLILGDNQIDGSQIKKSFQKNLPASGLCGASQSTETQKEPLTYAPITSSTIMAETSENFPSTFLELTDDFDSEMQEYCKVFETFDENGDGKLSADEVRESMAKLGINITEKELASMMMAIDKNGNGFVDLEEFLSLYKTRSEEGILGCIEEEDEENLKRAFKVFDKNQDGYITAQELQSVLSSLGVSQDTNLIDCRHMIRGVDLNGDGQIDFEEFKQMMSRKRSRSSATSKHPLEKSLSAVEFSSSRKAMAQF